MNRSYRASLPNRIQDMEERILGVEDTVEEIDSLVKENVKSNIYLADR